MIFQINFGNSITRVSDKNSARYIFTALELGSSGVPKLVNKIPVLSTLPCS